MLQFKLNAIHPEFSLTLSFAIPKVINLEMLLHRFDRLHGRRLTRRNRMTLLLGKRSRTKGGACFLETPFLSRPGHLKATLKTFISCYRTSGPWSWFESPRKPNASSISTPSWRAFEGLLEVLWRGFWMLKFRRVAIRGAQPSARLCEEICLSEGSAGGLSKGSAGSLRGFCGVSAGFCGGPRDFPRFSGVVTLCLWPSGTVGLKGPSADPFEKPSKTLQKPFRDLFRDLFRDPFWGLGFCSRNESLEATRPTKVAQISIFLGVVLLHLPCETSEARFWQFNAFSTYAHGLSVVFSQF